MQKDARSALLAVWPRHTIPNMRFTLLILALAVMSAIADTEIHRCLLEDGTFAFQETPCPEPAADANDPTGSGEAPVDSETRTGDENVFDFVNPFDEPAGPPVPVEPTLPERLSENRSACEKATRDAIDAIDLEMRETTYSKEQGQEYLADLLELTRQLRACKQL